MMLIMRATMMLIMRGRWEATVTLPTGATDMYVFWSCSHVHVHET